MISSEQMLIECFKLNDRGIWELYTYTETDGLKLDSIDFACSLDVIYEDVILDND